MHVFSYLVLGKMAGDAEAARRELLGQSKRTEAARNSASTNAKKIARDKGRVFAGAMVLGAGTVVTVALLFLHFLGSI